MGWSLVTGILIGIGLTGLGITLFCALATWSALDPFPDKPLSDV